MRMLLEVDIPPTDNKIYFNLPRGGRTLSSQAVTYKKNVKFAIDRLLANSDAAWEKECEENFKPDVEYEIYITLYMHGLSCKGWMEGKAKNRYKRIDTTNRQKLLIDAVMESVGVDDSHIFEVHLQKTECASKEEERAWILLREIEPRCRT